MSILDEIVANKRAEIAQRKAALSVSVLKARAGGKRPDFLAGLKSAGMGLIAEVKKRSPSAGPIREPFAPAAIAEAYERAGAQAISVLMDQRYFGGGEDDFHAVRSAVGLPLLYKEFVVDAWQVWHASSLGASAVLLIAAVLDKDALDRLAAECGEAGVEPLLEIHDEEDARKACATSVRCIGINNRDLRTFKVSVETTFRLKSQLPPDRFIVSESGIRSADDVERLKAGGIGAVLVGEHLLRQPDLQGAVRQLMDSAWR